MPVQMKIRSYMIVRSHVPNSQGTATGLGSDRGLLDPQAQNAPVQGNQNLWRPGQLGAPPAKRIRIINAPELAKASRIASQAPPQACFLCIVIFILCILLINWGHFAVLTVAWVHSWLH